MTGSLAYRKNANAILRGVVPDKYHRIVPHVPGERVLEIGSAEGVLALLLARAGKHVTAIEQSAERSACAIKLRDAWLDSGLLTAAASTEHACGSAADAIALVVPGAFDTLVAVRMIYYLREDIDAVFAEVAKRIPTVVLCGNRNRADRWRAGAPDAPLGDFNRYAAREGMRELLERHGYRIDHEVTDGDEIVVGVLDRPETDQVQDIADS